MQRFRHGHFGEVLRRVIGPFAFLLVEIFETQKLLVDGADDLDRNNRKIISSEAERRLLTTEIVSSKEGSQQPDLTLPNQLPFLIEFRSKHATVEFSSQCGEELLEKKSNHFLFFHVLKKVVEAGRVFPANVVRQMDHFPIEQICGENDTTKKCMYGR